jgi:hypothetical protein
VFTDRIAPSNNSFGKFEVHAKMEMARMRIISANNLLAHNTMGAGAKYARQTDL